jgi:hypothetical protein
VGSFNFRLPPQSTVSAGKQGAASGFPQDSREMTRHDLSDAALLRLVAVAVAAIIGWFVVRPWLPEAWRVPGSPALYLTGVTGVVLLLVPAAFAFVKRGGLTRHPVRWFNAHVACSCLGFVLIAIHSGGYLRRAPALLLVVLFALAALGVWARVRGSRRMAATFASRAPAFSVPDAAARGRLRDILAAKRRLLLELDPQAREGTFSVTLGHWRRTPRLAYAYHKFAREESVLLGTRRTLPASQAWWRPLHMALAWIFVAGVLIHVLTVTFFAGYVADGGPITWWHLAAW